MLVLRSTDVAQTSCSDPPCLPACPSCTCCDCQVTADSFGFPSLFGISQEAKSSLPVNTSRKTYMNFSQGLDEDIYQIHQIHKNTHNPAPTIESKCKDFFTKSEAAAAKFQEELLQDFPCGAPRALQLLGKVYVSKAKHAAPNIMKVGVGGLVGDVEAACSTSAAAQSSCAGCQHTRSYRGLLSPEILHGN